MTGKIYKKNKGKGPNIGLSPNNRQALYLDVCSQLLRFRRGVTELQNALQVTQAFII